MPVCAARPAPPKPWERQQGSAATESAVSPLGPSTAGDGAPKPWELPQGAPHRYTASASPTAAHLLYLVWMLL